MITVKMEWYDLERLLNSYDFIDEFEAKIISSYIDDCVLWELNFNQYVWNVIPFNVVCLKGGKKEALKYIEENLCCSVEDCVIYECKLLGGVYLEWS